MHTPHTQERSIYVTRSHGGAWAATRRVQGELLHCPVCARGEHGAGVPAVRGVAAVLSHPVRRPPVGVLHYPLLAERATAPGPGPKVPPSAPARGP